MSRSDSVKVSKKITLYNDVLGAIEGTNKLRFPNKYICYYKPPNRKRTLLLVSENEVVEEVEKENLLTDILSFCNNQAGKNKTSRQVTERAGQEIYRYVFRMMKCQEEVPALFRKLDEPGYCFHRVPYLPDSEMKTPLFDDFISRQSDPITTASFAGSLFDPKSDKQQYLWMTGEGGEGKSTFTSLIARWLGPACAAECPPNTEAAKRFIVSNMVHKRLILFSDIDSLKFVNSGAFRSLTGDDPQKSEEKGIQAKTIFNFNAKFMFTSNHELTLDYLDANVRRALYVTVRKPEAPVNDYKERFHAEGPGILHKCLAAYEANKLSDGKLPIPSAEITGGLVSEQTEIFEEVFAQNFTKKPYNVNDEAEKLPKITSSALSMYLKKQRIFLRDYDIDLFKKWLVKDKAIEKRRLTRKKISTYIGIEIKQPGLSAMAPNGPIIYTY